MSIKRKLARLVGSTIIPELFDSFFKKPKVLFYHGVELEPISNSIIQSNQMSFEDFRKQILFLQKNFEIISVDDFYNRFVSKRLNGKELVITFDDGYKNNLYVVAPFLDQLKIPFTVFICPDLIESESMLPTYYVRMSIYSDTLEELYIKSLNKTYMLSSKSLKNQANNELVDIIKTSNSTEVDKIITDIKSNFSQEQLTVMADKYSSEKLMNWSEIVDISQNYNCTIASHTLNHSILHSKQSASEVDKQLINSKEKVISKLKKCDYFAFPNGNIQSVCNYSIEKASTTYKLGFAVNGSAVDYNDHKGYVSRISLAPEFGSFKVQTLILANIK